MKTIVIADSSPLIVEGIQKSLTVFPETHVTGVFCDFAKLVKGLEQTPPDLLILDSGIEIASRSNTSNTLPIWKSQPSLNTLLFHTELNPVIIRRYLSEGVKSYLLRSVDTLEFQEAVQTVFNGGIFIQRSVLKSILDKTLHIGASKYKNNQLTQRELQIIELIVNEYSTKEIAEKLYISFNTVESHRKNLIIKLGVKNSAGIVREAMRLNLCP